MAYRHIHPAAAGQKHVKYAVQNHPIIGPRPTGVGLGRKQRPDELPFVVHELTELHEEALRKGLK
jgi:hypothetical protein